MSDHDDVLARMSRALGEEKSGDSERSATTRARILGSLGGSRAPSLRRPWLPVLLLLGVGTSAWASQSEGVRSWLSHVTSESAVIEPRQRARADSGSAHGSIPGPRPSEAHVPPDRSVDDAARAVPSEPRQPEQQRGDLRRGRPLELESLAASSPLPTSSASPLIARSAAPSPSAAKSSDHGLALYQSAHRAQFSEGDCRAAIDGYRGYLSAHPSGTFEPEARYNSALCSIGLGDHATARAALRPFAEGAYGSYRRDRALQLLEAIGP